MKNQEKLLELYRELAQKQRLYISNEEKLQDLVYDYNNDKLHENVYIELIKKYNTIDIENDIERLEKQIKELEK